MVCALSAVQPDVRLFSLSTDELIKRQYEAAYVLERSRRGLVVAEVGELWTGG